MMTMNRSTVVLVLVIVTAVAVGAVVAANTHGPGAATAMGTYGSDSLSAQGLADTGTATSSINTPTGADPAKQEPVLNLFHSRNPFIQVTSGPTTNVGGEIITTPTPSTSPSASGSPGTSVPHAANITLVEKSGAATYNNQVVGAKLPPSSPLFKIIKLSSAGVQFKLLNGYALEDGSTTFLVPVGTAGTTVILSKGTGGTQKTVTIKVLQIVYKTTGGSGSGDSGSGGSGSGSGSGSGGGSSGSLSSTGSPSGSSSTTVHTIKVLSIDTKNGTPSTTLVVAGATYANKQVGDTFTTSWGQVKVVGINGPGQTVTLLHADVRLTIHVGQSYSK